MNLTGRCSRSVRTTTRTTSLSRVLLVLGCSSFLASNNHIVQGFSVVSLVKTGERKTAGLYATTSVASDDDEGVTEAELSSQTISVKSSTTSPTSSATQSFSSNGNRGKEKNLLEGRWEEMNGNYILRPPVSSSPYPKALIHFLGGALVGASPHVAYRYILEKLSERGYVVVATPYKLTFDHLTTCDDVISRFEQCAPALARQYGAVPVVGIGHSCGALLQVIITSLFPDTPRAANVLMSYNNKPITEAVPFFEELVSPLSVALASSGNMTMSVKDDDTGESWSPPSAVDMMKMSLQLAKVSAQGNIPSDELISDIARKVLPPVSPLSPGDVALPSAIRESFDTVINPVSTVLNESGILPFTGQIVEVVDQIPDLILEVAAGVKDFVPTPDSLAAVAKKAYRARKTLLIQFENDGIDETEILEDVLAEAERIMRMKRPMVTMGLERKVLQGGHATPLLAPPAIIASRAEDILGVDEAKERLLYKQADDIVEELSVWLEGLVD